MESKRLLKTQVIETLAYADIFDYPLKEEEVMRWLIGKKSNNSYKKLIKKVNGVVFRKDGFLYLSERENIVTVRKQRQAYARKKLERAKSITKFLSLIPTIALIGLSGSLAMVNAKRHDDIDIFIVSLPNTLWLTRFFAVVTLELLGMRRRPGTQKIGNTVCLNMFIDRNHLTIPKDQQSLFTAHEVCQLMVLYNKNHTYEKFLNENSWVKKYLPNAIMAHGKPATTSNNISHVLSILEYLAKSLQLFYMRIHHRKPLLREGMLGFYPKQYNVFVLKEYERRRKRYNGAI